MRPKEIEGRRLAGLGAVDEGPHARQVPPFVRRDGADQVMEGEVWQPGQGPPVRLDDVEQRPWFGNPFEGVEGHDRCPRQQRQQETRDQPHVVIERQPRDNHIVRPEPQRLGITFDLL